MKKYLFFIIALALSACNSKVPELTGISLNKKKLTLEVGETYRLKVSFTPEEVAEAAPELVWLSSDEDVATVKNGKVTAKAVGKATITATCDKHEAECVLTVVEAGENPDPDPDPDPDPVNGRLVLNSYDIELLFDQTFQLVAMIETDEGEQTPEDPVIWSNIHTNVAHVDETGLVTGNQRGFDTITATCGKLTAQCAVYVMPRTIKTGFSAGEGKLVSFAPANLAYENKSLSFYLIFDQLHCIGPRNDRSNPSYSGDIDLFGWGTGNNPMLYSTTFSDYETWTDWGSKSVSGLDAGSWRTPSKEEWEYLLNGRENAEKLKTLVNIEAMQGLVLLPDEWWPPKRLWITPNATEYITNKISIATWREMESYGAVFLVAGGYRVGSEVTDADVIGYYWSSTPADGEMSTGAYALEFGGIPKNPGGELNPEYRLYGCAVRLIRNLGE